MLRFAPSPTGDMHISDLRIAILNYLVAQQKNEQFLVRIEDTNSESNIEGKDTEIMMILEKFALIHNSVFHQSEHLNLYQTLALRLLKEEKAFVCKCKNEEPEGTPYSGPCESLKQEDYTTLKKSGEKFVIRIKSPKHNIHNMDTFVIIKNNGIPSYNFACATDDMMSNIDTVIRGEEHLLNTPKQIHIKNLLGYNNETSYTHIPIILNNEEISIQQLFEEGFLPDAILNYLLLLGYVEAPKEIFTLPQAIEWFDLNNLSSSPTTFDIDKLRFINREHLKLMDNKKLSSLFGFADTDIGKLAKVYLEECSTTTELKSKIHPIFSAKEFSGQYAKEMKSISLLIASAPEFETFNELEKYLMAQSKMTKENLSNSLRKLLTGTGNGPELEKIYPLIKSYILEVAS